MVGQDGNRFPSVQTHPLDSLYIKKNTNYLVFADVFAHLSEMLLLS